MGDNRDNKKMDSESIRTTEDQRGKEGDNRESGRKKVGANEGPEEGGEAGRQGDNRENRCHRPYV